jgi:hypothetical protein
VRSARGALPALLLAGFPAPPPEPGGTVTEYRARHKSRRIASVAGLRDRAAVLVRLAVAIVLGAAHLSEAVPDTMRFRLYHLPAQLADLAAAAGCGPSGPGPGRRRSPPARLTALPAVTDDLTTSRRDKEWNAGYCVRMRSAHGSHHRFAAPRSQPPEMMAERVSNNPATPSVNRALIASTVYLSVSDAQASLRRAISLGLDRVSTTTFAYSSGPPSTVMELRPCSKYSNSGL